jgi:hypothetical protein
MTRLMVVASIVVAAAGSANAQAVDLSAVSPPGASGNLAISGFDPSDAVAPISVVEGKGIKVGEGTVIHPYFGLSTGLDSNVFYESTNVQAAGVLRIMGQLSIGSLSYGRLHPSGDPMAAGTGDSKPDDATDREEGAFQYWASARLAYDQVVGDRSNVDDTSGLGVGILARGIANPKGIVGFGFDENFVRLIRAANFETTQNQNRDVNILRAMLMYHPYGRSISGYLYYKNTLDIFENTFNEYPDRMDHRVGVHPVWRLFPETMIYGDVSMGYVTGIGSDPGSQKKVTSYPLIAKAGIATLLDLRTMLNASIGYTNGFYSSGPSFSAPTIETMLAFRYSPLGRVGVGYTLMYQDSVNANYYRDHMLVAFLQQDFAPFVLAVQPEVHFREYDGVTVPSTTMSLTRDDTIFAVVAGIHYAYRDWLGAVLDYRFSTVQTDFRYSDAMGQPVDPSYARHELLLGMRIAM